MKGNQLGRQGGKQQPKARQQEPRAAQNEDFKGRHRQSLGDKTAATGKIFLPLLAGFRPPPLASSVKTTLPLQNRGKLFKVTVLFSKEPSLKLKDLNVSCCFGGRKLYFQYSNFLPSSQHLCSHRRCKTRFFSFFRVGTPLFVNRKPPLKCQLLCKDDFALNKDLLFKKTHPF